MTASTTPLSSPALDHIIERPRLISLLEEGDARVTLFAAPAGYGKTTLARQWSARQRGPVAWYRTTRASGDVAALAVGLDVLLDRTAPQPRRDPGRIAAIASVNAHPLPLGRALASTYAALGQDVLLVLDEWEAAGTEEADELVGLLVDELDIRFLVTSRSPPPWFTSRLSVYGEGLEVGAGELAMTDEEALSVLSVVASPKHPESLLATAHGWPAVLGLAAMRSATELPAMPAETLYDYLASELLDSAAPEVRHGLELIAATTASDPPVVESLLGEATERILVDARRLGLVRVDEDSALSLHPLLRDLLLARLQKLAGRERENLVESFAPLVERRRWDEALAAAEAVPAAGFVSAALDRSLPDLLRAGRVATLRRWVAAGRSAGADHGLVDYADAEVAFREAAFDRAIALGELAASSLAGDLAARAHLVAARAANLADRRERAHLHLLAAQKSGATPETQTIAHWTAFIQAVDDEEPQSADLLVEYEASVPGDPENLIRTADGRVRLSLLEGPLEPTLENSELVLPLLEMGGDPLVRSSFLNIYSTALAIGGRYEEALAAAEHELAIAEEFELEFVLRHALVNRARAFSGMRRIGPAERALKELERRLARGQDVFLSASCSVERARLYLTVGDHQRAFASVCEALPARLSRCAKAEYLAIRALTHAALGEARKARATAQRACETSRFPTTRLLAEVALAVATAGASQGTRTAVRTFLSAQELGAYDPIVLGCRASTDYAAALASDEEHREALTAVLLRSGDAALGRRLDLIVPRSIRRSSKLSPRELEVQELIAQGLTNEEIARLLFISPSTTKVHVRHILEKLGVRSRVEVARLFESPTNDG